MNRARRCRYSHSADVAVAVAITASNIGAVTVTVAVGTAWWHNVGTVMVFLALNLALVTIMAVVREERVCGGGVTCSRSVLDWFSFDLHLNRTCSIGQHLFFF